MARKQENEIMTTDEAARYLKMSTRTVRLLLGAKKLPGAKVGNTWRLSKADLDAFIRNGGRQ
jgi:excisionase family DNA binding protein